jgi:hypothetical protein
VSPREWADIDRENRLMRQGQIKQDDLLITRDQIKDIIHADHLSPADLFGQDYMDKYLEALSYAKDTLAREARKDPPPPPPAASSTEAKIEAKPEKAEKGLDPALDPKKNPFIRLD